MVRKKNSWAKITQCQRQLYELNSKCVNNNYHWIWDGSIPFDIRPLRSSFRDLRTPTKLFAFGSLWMLYQNQSRLLVVPFHQRVAKCPEKTNNRLWLLNALQMKFESCCTKYSCWVFYHHFHFCKFVSSKRSSCDKEEIKPSKQLFFPCACNPWCSRDHHFIVKLHK